MRVTLGWVPVTVGDASEIGVPLIRNADSAQVPDEVVNEFVKVTVKLVTLSAELSGL